MIKKQIADVIDSNLNTEFEYGKWDCCIFAATCVEPDFVNELLGQYDTQDGAIKKIASMGGIDAKLQELGWSKIDKKYARTGDLAATKINDNLGVIQGGEIVLLTLNGMTRKPISRAENVWRKDD